MALKLLHIWTYILMASVDTAAWAPGLSGMVSYHAELSLSDLARGADVGTHFAGPTYYKYTTTEIW